MKKYPTLATEQQIQAAIIEWAALQHGRLPGIEMLVHVPNGGYRLPATGRALKRAGVQAGYPDLILDVARGEYHGLRIELKRDRRSRVSDDQKKWLDNLNKHGYLAIVCVGYEQTIRIITQYLLQSCHI